MSNQITTLSKLLKPAATRLSKQEITDLLDGLKDRLEANPVFIHCAEGYDEIDYVSGRITDMIELVLRTEAKKPNHSLNKFSQHKLFNVTKKITYEAEHTTEIFARDEEEAQRIFDAREERDMLDWETYNDTLNTLGILDEEISIEQDEDFSSDTSFSIDSFVETERVITGEIWTSEQRQSLLKAVEAMIESDPRYAPDLPDDRGHKRWSSEKFHSVAGDLSQFADSFNPETAFSEQNIQRAIRNFKQNLNRS